MKLSSDVDSNQDDVLTAEREIMRLISTYSFLLDSGKFDKVANLLQHATLEVPGSAVKGLTAIAQFLNSGIQRHSDGTPRTWHSVSNILIDVDLVNCSASSTSYFTVHQALPGFALQAICTGHYKDQFAKFDGRWQFTHRTVVAHLMGDIQFHVCGNNAGVNP